MSPTEGSRSFPLQHDAALDGRPSAIDTVSAYLDDMATSLRMIDYDEVAHVVETVVNAMESGRRVLIAGNGGSASTATHMCCDLNAAALIAAVNPGHAIGLSDNIPTLTALSNDISYSQVFGRQIPIAGREDDVFVAISVSGTSPNLVEAAAVARHHGLKVVSMLGMPGALWARSDAALAVGAGDYGLAEDLHLAVNHMMVRAIRRVRSYVCAQSGNQTALAALPSRVDASGEQR